MQDAAYSGLEIRRILLLSLLRNSLRGMTLPQIVKDCSMIPGWNVHGKGPFELVGHVIQTLIDESLVAVRRRIELTAKGREYLEDPLKWRIEPETREEVEQKLFWDSIHRVFDRAYARLRAKGQN